MEAMSAIHRAVTLDISSPVKELVCKYHNWLSASVPPHMLSPVEVMLDTNMLGPFIDYVLYEIFKEHHLSNLMDHLPESDRYLRDSLGVPLELGGRWKLEFLNTVIIIIGAYLPDLNFSRIENTQYGMASGYLLMMHVERDFVPM